MEAFAISGLINGIISTAFGILVFLKNSKDRKNIIYFLITFVFAIWSFSYWRWLLSESYDVALFWVQILSIGSLFIPVFFFHWSLLLTNRYDGLNKFILSLSYVVALVVLSFYSTPYFISGLEHKLFFDFWPNPGVIYIFYFIGIYLFLTIYALLIIAKELSKTDDYQRKGQYIFVIIGSIIGFGGGLTNFFLWFDIAVPPYGNFVAGLFPLFLGYSTLKYRLFNMKAIATELLVAFMVVVLFIQVFFSEGTIEFVLRSVFLLIVLFAGFLLVRSVYGEVKARQKIEKLAEDLKVANERLKEMDRVKTEFLSIASHQFRSPITAIKGYTSMMLEGTYGEVPEKMKEPVERVFESSNNLAIIVEDFLNLSRIEQGRMKYEWGHVDIKDLVQKAVDELSAVAEKKNLKLIFEPSEAEYMHKADPGKFKQVVTNLIDNAIKYTPKGTITVFLSKKDGKTVIRVKDTGVGIPQEEIKNLFGQFKRATNANRVNVMGSGLGLYIAKQIVEAHGGTIQAHSEGEGKGSEFIVLL